MLALSWCQYKTISLTTDFFFNFLIRLQIKATKKPYEAKNDFDKFLHKLVCFLFENG